MEVRFCCCHLSLAAVECVATQLQTADTRISLEYKCNMNENASIHNILRRQSLPCRNYWHAVKIITTHVDAMNSFTEKILIFMEKFRRKKMKWPFVIIRQTTDKAEFKFGSTNL